MHERAGRDAGLTETISRERSCQRPIVVSLEVGSMLGWPAIIRAEERDGGIVTDRTRRRAVAPLVMIGLPVYQRAWGTGKSPVPSSTYALGWVKILPGRCVSSVRCAAGSIDSALLQPMWTSSFRQCVEEDGTNGATNQDAAGQPGQRARSKRTCSGLDTCNPVQRHAALTETNDHHNHPPATHNYGSPPRRGVAVTHTISGTNAQTAHTQATAPDHDAPQTPPPPESPVTTRV